MKPAVIQSGTILASKRPNSGVSRWPLPRWLGWLLAIAGAVIVWTILAAIGVKSSSAQLIAAPVVVIVLTGAFELATRMVNTRRSKTPSVQVLQGQPAAETNVNVAGVLVGILALIGGLIVQSTIASAAGAVLALLGLLYLLYLVYGGIFR
jgi:hypothetical protein